MSITRQDKQDIIQKCLTFHSFVPSTRHCFHLFLIRLPNGNGLESGVGKPHRGDSLGGVIDDVTGTDESKKDIVLQRYGRIENWNVSNVLNMKYVFQNKGDFNADIR